MTHIAKRSDVASRTQWSQHQLENAFNYIVFADPVRGIFGATPVETMHAFRKGAVTRIIIGILLVQNMLLRKQDQPRHPFGTL